MVFEQPQKMCENRFLDARRTPREQEALACEDDETMSVIRVLFLQGGTA